RVPVIRIAQRAEDQRTAGDRKHATLAARHVPSPQLDVATVLLPPVTVEVEEEVQAPVELEDRVSVEVRVDPQHPATADLMDAAALHVRIGDEVLDPRQPLQETDERAR